MQISEFVRVTGLSRDTARFYVRLGLLRPKLNGKGGRNPYQSFTDEDVRAVEVIRVAQSLGMSLKEIAALNEERRDGRITRQRSIEVMTARLALLETKAFELKAMTRYVRAKIGWLRGGEQGLKPDFRHYAGRTDARAVKKPSLTFSDSGSPVLNIKNAVRARKVNSR